MALRRTRPCAAPAAPAVGPQALGRPAAKAGALDQGTSWSAGCTVQVKGGLQHVFRAKTVVVQEAVFSETAERHGLGAALAQWQEAAEGTVAAAALEVKAAEQRVFMGIMRCVRGACNCVLLGCTRLKVGLLCMVGVRF